MSQNDNPMDEQEIPDAERQRQYEAGIKQDKLFKALAETTVVVGGIGTAVLQAFSEKARNIFVPLLTAYILAVVFGTTDYVRNGKPKRLENTKVGGFIAKVASHAFIMKGNRAELAAGIDMEAMRRWAYMTTYSGGRAYFGSVAESLTDTRASANAQYLSDTEMDDLRLFRPGDRDQILTFLSLKLSPEQTSFEEKLNNIPLVAILAISLVFMIGVREVAEGSTGVPQLQNTSMLTGILSGFAGAEGYGEMAKVLPAIMLVKFVGPIAASWVMASAGLSQAKETQGTAFPILKPESSSSLAAKWMFGVLPTKNMLQGYSAQIHLNLLTQLLSIGGILALWRSGDVNQSVVHLGQYFGIIYGMRFLTWLVWYGYTAFSVATGEKYERVMFTANETLILREGTPAIKVVSNDMDAETDTDDDI